MHFGLPWHWKNSQIPISICGFPGVIVKRCYLQNNGITLNIKWHKSAFLCCEKCPFKSEFLYTSRKCSPILREKLFSCWIFLIWIWYVNKWSKKVKFSTQNKWKWHIFHSRSCVATNRTGQCLSKRKCSSVLRKQIRYCKRLTVNRRNSSIIYKKYQSSFFQLCVITLW